MNVENQNKVKQHNQNDNVKPNFQEFDQKKPYCQENTSIQISHSFSFEGKHEID